jgi:hypothetical protein
MNRSALAAFAMICVAEPIFAMEGTFHGTREAGAEDNKR